MDWYERHQKNLQTLSDRMKRRNPMHSAATVAKMVASQQDRLSDPDKLKAAQAAAAKANAASRSPEARAKRSESARKAWTPEMREQARQRQREYQERVRLALSASGDVKLST